MIGRRTAVGLSLLCALLFSAIAVQSASAAKAVNTTAFTCVKDSGFEDFEDAHCDKFVGAGNGEYGHVEIAKDQTIKATTTQLSNVILRSKAAGATIEITCTKAEGSGELHNVETPTNKHTITGRGTTKFNSCTVNKPAKCVVAEPITTSTEFEGVEGLGAGGNEMGGELKPEGGGGTFVELTFANKGGETCNIAGKWPVTGTVIATAAPAPTAKHTGATAIYTKAMTEETLKFGPEKASIEVTTTVTSASGTPLTVTTVT